MSGGRYVYVVQSQSGMVKIGSSRAPQSRADAIHSHSPVPCRLIAAWPASMKEEFDLHMRFDKYRAHAEWFCCVGEVADFVREIHGRGLVKVEEWPACLIQDRAERTARWKARLRMGARANLLNSPTTTTAEAR